MAEIKGIKGLTEQEILAEVERGGKFVMYLWCVSVLVMTFKRSSSIHFVRAGEGTIKKSLPYTLLTLVAGWWGVPWGPIYSLESVFKNISGGVDVTEHIVRRGMPQPEGEPS